MAVKSGLQYFQTLTILLGGKAMSQPTPDSQPSYMAPAAPRFLDVVRERIRAKHYSLRTEEAYVHWIKRFILFHGKRHPRDMGAPEVEAFLSYLANTRNVAVATHHQALSALLFLYKDVLGVDLPWLTNLTRPRRPKRLPTVLNPSEVLRVFSHLSGTHLLMARLLYGTGMRLLECVQLRVKDMDFERREILIRDAKGNRSGHDAARLRGGRFASPCRPRPCLMGTRSKRD
jgi:integrase